MNDDGSVGARVAFAVASDSGLSVVDVSSSADAVAAGCLDVSRLAALS